VNQEKYSQPEFQCVFITNSCQQLFDSCFCYACRGHIKRQTNSVALSPWANYTNWMTATCRRNLVPTFVDRGVSRGQLGRSHTVVNLSFLDRHIKRHGYYICPNGRWIHSNVWLSPWIWIIYIKYVFVLVQFFSMSVAQAISCTTVLNGKCKWEA
jgi:hypothetical protein